MARSGIYWLVIFVLTLASGSAAAKKPRPSDKALIMDMNGLRVLAGPPWKQNFRIEVDGIPFTNASLLYAHRPGHAGRYYGYEDDSPTFRSLEPTRTKDRVQLTVPLKSAHNDFSGTQTLEMTRDRRIRIVVDAAFATTATGSYEHKIGGIYGGWIAGRDFMSENHDWSPKSGRFSDVPSLAEQVVVSGFKSLLASTSYGEVKISASGTVPVSLVDYRQSQTPFEDAVIWVGVRDTPVKGGTRIRYAVEFQFPPSPPAPSTPARASTKQISDVLPLPVAFENPPLTDLILPRPKSLTWLEQDFPLSRTQIRLECGPEELRASCETMTKNFIEDVNRAAKTEVLVKLPDTAYAGEEFKVNVAHHARMQQKDEWYRIRIGKTCTVEVDTTSGLSAAYKTLRQLLRQSATAGTYLRGCEIEDWSSLPFRSIHFYSGKGGRDTQIKMLREVLGPLKITHVIYHCDNIRWESHPELHPDNSGMPKDDARAFVEEARKWDIRVVPLINTFGHSGWFLNHQQYRHLADDPENPFAYDPTLPEVYNFVHDIYNEAIELFKPDYFHIGHDEITLKGFPKKLALQKIGAMKLIADDIRHYRDYFAARGIRTMIWADMFIGPGEANDFALAPTAAEARRRRALIPKDVVMCDWHYTADSAGKYRSLRVLTDDGFDVVASTWFHPDNITHFMKAASLQHERTSSKFLSNGQGESLGLLQTTWAGANLNARAVQNNPDQFAAYVLAAEASWNGGDKESDALGYNFRNEFARLWNPPPSVANALSGWSVDLSDHASQQIGRNLKTYEPAPQSITQKEPSLLSMIVSENDKRQDRNPAGVDSLQGWRFLLNAADRLKATLLNNRFTASRELPSAVRINVKRSTSELVFALAATHTGAPDKPLGKVTMGLADGSTVTEELELGRTIYALEDFRSSPAAPLVATFDGAGRNSREFEFSPAGSTNFLAPTNSAVHALRVRNPKPEQQVEWIEISSLNQGPGILIFGITGIDSRQP